MRAKICKNCEYLKLIYKYGYRFYYSLRFPSCYCAFFEQMIDMEKGCENYRAVKLAETDLTCERLDEAEEDIKVLLALLESATQKFGSPWYSGAVRIHILI